MKRQVKIYSKKSNYFFLSGEGDIKYKVYSKAQTKTSLHHLMWSFISSYTLRLISSFHVRRTSRCFMAFIYERN